MTTRIAAVLAALLLAAAAVATLAPTSAIGTSCGTWVAPEYDRDQVAKLVARGSELSDQLDALGANTSDLAAGGDILAATYLECDSALDGRRLVALVFLGLAVAAPFAVIYVGRPRTREPINLPLN